MNHSDQVFSQTQAGHIQKQYLCSQCYGPLQRYALPDSRAMLVKCPICGDGKGFVHYKYYERRLDKSIAEAHEVAANLRGILPCLTPKSKKSAQEIIEELGF